MIFGGTCYYNIPDDENQMIRERMVNTMDYLFRAGLFLLGAVLFSSVCQAAGGQRDVVKASIAVDARANSSSGGQGKDTGIDVTERDVLIVNVDPNDDWSAGSGQPCTRNSNADGLTKCYGTYSMSNLSANYGSLVGRIGDGPFFLIGTSFFCPFIYFCFAVFRTVLSIKNRSR